MDGGKTPQASRGVLKGAEARTSSKTLAAGSPRRRSPRERARSRAARTNAGTAPGQRPGGLRLARGEETQPCFACRVVEIPRGGEQQKVQRDEEKTVARPLPSWCGEGCVARRTLSPAFPREKHHCGICKKAAGTRGRAFAVQNERPWPTRPSAGAGARAVRHQRKRSPDSMGAEQANKDAEPSSIKRTKTTVKESRGEVRPFHPSFCPSFLSSTPSFFPSAFLSRSLPCSRLQHLALYISRLASCAVAAADRKVLTADPFFR